ncbi:MAG: aldehyde dehydrogenase family protein [candidate division Zixibacteria bacterium]|nr:aldehyde dehydrogenase family protein [candidate division Zixibacteria bacterium]
MPIVTEDSSKIQVSPGQLFIGGKWQNGADTLETINPATGEVITTFAEAGSREVDSAVKAAREAFPAWRDTPPAKRGKLLWKLADLIGRDRERLATLETIDNGKPYFESGKIDIPFTAEIFRYFAGWATKIHGSTLPARGATFAYTRREPLGVVGLIIPWNLPLVMCSWKLGPALATGNTCVLKPAEQTPLTALALADLIKEAGFPDGVVNIITGRGTVTGAELVKHPDVNKISFTGSVPVGREIMKSAAETLKKVTLELGGKSPNIIFADANIDSAIKGAVNGIFYGKGELCCAGSRLLVDKSIHTQVVDGIKALVAKMQVGDPFDKKTRIGALVSKEQMKKVLGYINIGKEDGASVVAGGARAEMSGEFANGCFVQPTVFDNVNENMRIAREEIFGPVLAVIPFENEDEALAIANNVDFGLAAAVWTSDISRAHRFADKLEAGTVWINTINMFDPALPFGGFKQSGFGRDLGEDALDGYLQTKSIWVNLS